MQVLEKETLKGSRRKRKDAGRQKIEQQNGGQMYGKNLRGKRIQMKGPKLQK